MRRLPDLVDSAEVSIIQAWRRTPRSHRYPDRSDFGPPVYYHAELEEETLYLDQEELANPNIDIAVVWSVPLEFCHNFDNKIPVIVFYKDKYYLGRKHIQLFQYQAMLPGVGLYASHTSQQTIINLAKEINGKPRRQKSR